jgi:hypothetical protein
MVCGQESFWVDAGLWEETPERSERKKDVKGFILTVSTTCSAFSFVKTNGGLVFRTLS